MTEKKKRSWNLPHVYIMFMIVMLVVVLLSYVVPSGEFERIADPNNPAIMQVNPDAFHYVNDAKPISVLDFFTAMHKGVTGAGDIIVMLLIACGALYLLEESGTIGAGIQALLRVAEGKETFVILALMAVFALLGAIGFGEGGIPFVPLCMTVVMGMGYDRVTGVATAGLGLCVGFASGVINMYTTGVSQQIMGIPLFSGVGFRSIALLVFVVVTAIYLLAYARKIKKDPTKSLVAEEFMAQETAAATPDEEIPFTGRKKIALLSLVIVFVLQAYGAINWGWRLAQISGLYLIFAVYLTIILGMKPNDAATKFGLGAARILPAALAIGFAGGVVTLMNQAKIIDTAVHSLGAFLQGKPVTLTFLLIYLVVIAFNFFVVSGSGKALILMPILSPLATILGINAQIMVLLYQYGDGFTNYFWPTAGALMAILAMCGLPYDKWVKFTWKFMVLIQIVAFILILVANAIGLQ